MGREWGQKGRREGEGRRRREGCTYYVAGGRWWTDASIRRGKGVHACIQTTREGGRGESPASSSGRHKDDGSARPPRTPGAYNSGARSYCAARERHTGTQGQGRAGRGGAGSERASEGVCSKTGSRQAQCWMRKASPLRGRAASLGSRMRITQGVSPYDGHWEGRALCVRRRDV